MRPWRSRAMASAAGAAHLACGLGGFLANVSFVAKAPPAGFVELLQVGISPSSFFAREGPLPEA